MRSASGRRSVRSASGRRPVRRADGRPLSVSAGFGAGAMLAVVFRELIPSSHGHADVATGAFLLGFVLPVVDDAVV